MTCVTLRNVGCEVMWWAIAYELQCGPVATQAKLVVDDVMAKLVLWSGSLHDASAAPLKNLESHMLLYVRTATTQPLFTSMSRTIHSMPLR